MYELIYRNIPPCYTETMPLVTVLFTVIELLSTDVHASSTCLILKVPNALIKTNCSKCCVKE